MAGKILVTGGAGFIGSALARRLDSEGWRVTVLDDFSTGHRSNLIDGAELIEVDLSQPDFLDALPSGGFDVVCHLAAQSSGPVSVDRPVYDFDVNARSTLLLSDWCLRVGVPRFVYASSMAIYGNPDSRFASEATPPVPRSPYGVSKLTSEHLLRLARVRGLESTCLRMFSVYGPGQDLSNRQQGMLSIFLAYLLDGVEVPVTGSLDRVRDFVFIDDVVDLWMEVIGRPSTPSAIYNAGTGITTSVGDLLKVLIAAVGLPEDHPIAVGDTSVNDQSGVAADRSLAESELGWTPQVKLSEGIERMVRWVREAAG